MFIGVNVNFLRAFFDFFGEKAYMPSKNFQIFAKMPNPAFARSGINT
jgi:hypothetical protein